MFWAPVQDDMLKVAFECTRKREQLRDPARRYQDGKPDLADFCLIRMSEIYPRHVVSAVDVNDFRVYRRNTREAIPTITPPQA